jgi:hypothetical protein
VVEAMGSAACEENAACGQNRHAGFGGRPGETDRGSATPRPLADPTTIPYPLGPTDPSNLKLLCRYHHLLTGFYTGLGG